MIINAEELAVYYYNSFRKGINFCEWVKAQGGALIFQGSLSKMLVEISEEDLIILKLKYRK